MDADVNERYDLIVVGLGAMGAAVTFQAARRGAKVLGIDRFDPPHSLGSTHAETRITRLAVGEGPQYLPLVARSHELWREIEAETGDRLFYETGGLIVTEPVASGERWQDFAVATHQIGQDAGIDCELLSPASVRDRYPAFKITDDMSACFEPTAGLVMCEQAVTSQLALARQAGAKTLTNAPVLDVDPAGDGVTVRTDSDVFQANQVVLATGPWLPEMVPPSIASQLTVTRQVVYWLEADDPDQFSVDNSPFLMWVGATDEQYSSLFPTPPGGTNGVKVLGEQFLESTTVDAAVRDVPEAEIDHYYETLLEPRISGLRRECVRTAVCLYTNTPDDHFLIDHDPRSDRITVMSPCSGHGFKHSAALGEAVAELLLEGSSHLDLSPFGSQNASPSPG